MEIELKKENYTTEVENSDVPVLIDFWATWCGPCRMVAPNVTKIAEDYSGKLKVCKVNVDNEEQLAMDFNIEVIPTLVLIKDGKEVNRISGYFTAQEIIEKLGI